MTLPKLTSITAELEAHLWEIRAEVTRIEAYIRKLDGRLLLQQYLAFEILDELNRRETVSNHCPHLDFDDTLSGKRCRQCGVETNG